ncbi:MarR family winged helix-turn-helix transcriptional regulator [Leucobacter sp. GX24907]
MNENPAMAKGRADVRLANEAWEAVMQAHARLTARFAEDGVFADLSMREYDVLYTLAKGGEAMRLCEVQEGVLLSQPALSRLVDRLVSRGLLERWVDATDRRAVRISLSEQGAKVQREVGRRHARSVARELGGALSADELRDLRALASKLTDAVCHI